ncbi:MAG: LamB/YcsF family protein [Tetrasphaera sp.]|nr:LamB/YcsF family protein [Tetrasphaera sp.]
MPAHRAIDLNADLGESFGRWRLGDDEAMLDVVTSANIACGFHAGDPLTLRRTCAAAVERGVVIGAQVGYDDLAGFGRRAMEVPSDELTAGILYQLGALDGLARVAGGRVRYVKPHGALYATAAVDERQARAVVAAVTAYDGSLPLLGLPGSVLLAVAQEAGVPTVREAFADRGYTASGNLVPRSEPGAFVEDPEVAAARMLRLVTTGEVAALDGSTLRLGVDSICVHGDSPAAVATARAVRRELAAAGVLLAPFRR